MPNYLYDVGRRNLLAAQIAWANLDNSPSGQTYKCCLVRTGAGQYQQSSTHTNMSQVAGFIANASGGSNNAIVTLANLANTTLGAADADDVTFSSVTSGQTIGAIVIYKENSNSDQSLNIPLVHIDTATGLPITSNGGDIIIVFDNGNNRLFRP